MPAPRYLWAPSPAGRIPGEDHAGASAVRSRNVGKRSKGGEEAGGALPSVPLDPFPRPRSPGRSPPLRPWSFAGFFWKKQKLANGNGWFGVQRGGVSSRFRCILCSRNKKEGRRGTGKLRAAVVGWHGEHLPPGICGRGEENHVKNQGADPQMSWGAPAGNAEIVGSSKVKRVKSKAGPCMVGDHQAHPETSPRSPAGRGCSALGCREPQLPRDRQLQGTIQ